MDERLQTLGALGAYLRQRREARGLTQTQAAAALGTSEGVIRNLEKGRNHPRSGLLLRYCRLVRADLELVTDLFADGATVAA